MERPIDVWPQRERLSPPSPPWADSRAQDSTAGPAPGCLGHLKVMSCVSLSVSTELSNWNQQPCRLFPIRRRRGQVSSFRLSCVDWGQNSCQAPLVDFPAVQRCASQTDSKGSMHVSEAHKQGWEPTICVPPQCAQTEVQGQSVGVPPCLRLALV